MRTEWIEAREKLFFETTPETFSAAMEAFRLACAQRLEGATDTKRTNVLALLMQIAVDTPSFLVNWNPAFGRMGAATRDALLSDESGKCLSLLDTYGAEELAARAKRQIAMDAKSQLRNVASRTACGKLHNFWGNDSASGIMEAQRCGASFVTTNPPIINIERNSNPESSSRIRADIRRDMPDADGVALAQRFTERIVLDNCKALYSLYRASEGREGFVCYQVNPLVCDDAAAMCEEAERTYHDVAGQLGGTPNIQFKLPGTSASLQAARQLTKKGIGVTITGSYSVSQHHAFAEAIESGCAAQSFLVMMSGRLDTPIAEELGALGVADAERLARFASAAVLSRSYAMLQKNGYKRSGLLVASLRGPWNILASLTGTTPPIHISVFPNKAEEFESEARTLLPGVGADLPDNVREVLEKSRIFRQAYYEEALPITDFDAFLPLNHTLNGFRKDYMDLMDYMTL